ncbi:MAG: ABC transporter substrate-binding protein, partial [Alphaproteobacteria bacterium]|nr:ABC transporter substrate-binding protein [Alphaproteobacteria bacterium]
FQEGYEGRWIMPGWSANDQLVAALGPQATEGVISMDTIPNEGSGAFKSFDDEYKRAMNVSGASNVFAAMSYDMVISLALALEAAGPSASPREIGQKMRLVANPDGTKVYGFAEGKDALKRGKINYEGASGALDFDEFGDVKGNFLMSVIEKGRLVRKDVVAG